VSVVRLIVATRSKIIKEMSGSVASGTHCILFNLDTVVSFSTYFRDRYCSKGSVIFRLSNGIIIKGARSDAVVVVGVVLDIFFLRYLELEWLGLFSDKWAGRRRNHVSAVGIF
jgi:hypothetical protein